jgi:hypothetical protein
LACTSCNTKATNTNKSSHLFLIVRSHPSKRHRAWTLCFRYSMHFN